MVLKGAVGAKLPRYLLKQHYHILFDMVILNFVSREITLSLQDRIEFARIKLQNASWHG